MICSSDNANGMFPKEVSDCSCKMTLPRDHVPTKTDLGFAAMLATWEVGEGRGNDGCISPSPLPLSEEVFLVNFAMLVCCVEIL